jgi:putative ATP-binding cassette transporter
VLLKKPRWVFADEATSALDAAAETSVYKSLSAQVESAQGALISIAHRPGVAAFHNRLWTLQTKATGGTDANTSGSDAGRYTLVQTALPVSAA